MFVDSHTHLLPDRLASAIRRFFAEHGAADFQYPLDDHIVLDRDRVDGIVTVWNLPDAHKGGMARELNASMIEATKSLAHFGHDAFDEAVTLLDTHPHLVAELTPVVSNPVPITAEVANRHADRISFGTDAPNTGYATADLLGRLRSCGVSDDTVDAICSANARRLVEATST